MGWRANMNTDTDTDPARPDDAVAVIGLSCRLPQAGNPVEFWRLLREGRSAIVPTPADRWPTDAYPDGAPADSGLRWGGFLDRVEEFDADFFGISPREAVATDPQQRLVLQLAREAREDAGIPPHRLRDTHTRV